MKAAILREGQLRVDSAPIPTPESGEVLVKTLACGICGSDLHTHLHAKSFAGITKQAGLMVFRSDADMIMGHEFCTEIVDYGPKTDAVHKIGTRVCSVPALPRPGRTCTIGYSNDVPGGFGEYMVLSNKYLQPVPADLPTPLAALTEPLAVGAHAVAKARLRDDDIPLVIGAGPVGLAVVIALRQRNHRPIVVSDYSPARRQLALRMGADRVIDPAEQSTFDSWRDIAGKEGFQRGQDRAVYFDCVGVPGILAQMITGAPKGARLVIVGVCMETDSFDPFLAIVKELNVQFVLGYTPQEFADTLKMIADSPLPLEEMITAKIPIDGVPEAFAELANPDRHVKVLVTP